MKEMANAHSKHGMTTTFPELFDRFSAAMLPAETPDATILRFRAIARAIRLDSHGLAQFDPKGEQLAFLCVGAAKLVARASGGREQVVSFHFAGELACVPNGAMHAYSIEALTPCELLAFPVSEFLELARSEPAILSQVCDRVLGALHRASEKSVALGRKTAQERVCSFLVGMTERIGVRQGAGFAMRLPMSRRDIADALGLTNETISRQFAELRMSGIIETSGRSLVTIPDINALRDLGGYMQLPERNAA